ncbi:EamA family transporter [Bdellovibrio svalbardensis]|uniref:DMT family transporter n=1 Tax=Bdellovibrio svalbardensis TaxID=2972972 RepID=A0ABT6DEF0_9BACT|nr:DMT family transporter [Bdellovibrio svalbardensis]MDG0815216.1 DMT family transporter [Bdellovibrio svalbardensis]
MEKLKSIIWVFIAILSIQGGATFAKQLFPAIGPEATTFLRVWISALLLLAVYRPWKQGLSRKAIFAVVLYGMSLGAMNLLFYLALERIPLGVAVALEFVGPLSVALFASRKARDFLWALLAAAGIILILPHTDFSQSIDLLGVLFALAAGVCWGLYIIFAKKVGEHIIGGKATALGMFVAALTVTPTSLSHVHFAELDGKIWMMAFFVAILSSALPYSLEMMALRSIPEKTFGVLMSLEPAFAALMGLLFLSENLNGTQWLAIFCVMAASAGSSLTAHNVTPPPQT